MPKTIDARLVARWITLNARIVSQVAEQIVREEAWWMAARSNKFALSETVWVDGNPAEPRESKVLRASPSVFIPATEADG